MKGIACFVFTYFLLVTTPVYSQVEKIILRVTALDLDTKKPLDSVKVTLYHYKNYKKKKQVLFNGSYEQGSGDQFVINSKSLFEKQGYWPAEIKEQYVVLNGIADQRVYLRTKKKKEGVKLVKPSKE